MKRFLSLFAGLFAVVVSANDPRVTSNGAPFEKPPCTLLQGEGNAKAKK